MALSLDSIKRDFARHKKKTGVLSVLALIMFMFIWRAVLEMRPTTALAENGSGSAAIPSETPPALAPDTAEHVRQSTELWKTLTETRGLKPGAAFTFDPAYYYSNRTATAEPQRVVPEPAPRLAVNSAEADRRALERQIGAQAQTLAIRSTVVGSSGSKPVAVINGCILGVGDQIQGFEITAIRVREVEVKKDGIKCTIQMTDADFPGNSQKH